MRKTFRFTWEGKRPRMCFTTPQLAKDKGRIALSNLKEYFHSTQLCPLTYWCNTDYITRWKDTEMSVFNFPIQTNIEESISLST